MLLLSKVLLVWLVCIMASRVIFSHIMRERWFIRRILVFGSAPHIARLRQLANGGRGRMFEPVVAAQEAGAGVVDQSLSPRRAAATAHLGHRHRRRAHRSEFPAGGRIAGLQVARRAGVRSGRFLRGATRPHRSRPHRADWLLFADGFAHGWASNTVKRGIDICISLALLTLTLPLMLLTAVLIRIDSRGPVLYRQRRIGLHGRSFTLLKFRSMTFDAEQGGDPRWASQQDPRITRVGSFIRPMRIDELPQLINVLRGEMSMIGPRPERPHFVEQLAKAIPLYS